MDLNLAICIMTIQIRKDEWFPRRYLPLKFNKVLNINLNMYGMFSDTNKYMVANAFQTYTNQRI